MFRLSGSPGGSFLVAVRSLRSIFESFPKLRDDLAHMPFVGGATARLPHRHSGVAQGAPCVKKEKGSISAGTLMITQGENNSAVLIDQSVVR
jgi:hypothetical protein